MNIKVTTKVSEVVGVDCSCFSINGKHFSARTCAEKMLWLRAISNIKVKLEHQRENPTPTEIMHYREAILESARSLEERYGSSRLFPLSSRRVTRRPSAASEAALMCATEANRQEVSSNEELNDTLREPDMVGEALHPDGVVTLTELGPAHGSWAGRWRVPNTRCSVGWRPSARAPLVSPQTRPWTWSRNSSRHTMCVARKTWAPNVSLALWALVSQPPTKRLAVSSRLCLWRVWNFPETWDPPL